MSRRVRLIVNPSSGKGRALELLPAVAGTLRDGGLELSILLSRDFVEARAMAEQAVADGVDVLAVMGGDGMMHLGVNTVAAAHRAGRPADHPRPDPGRHRQRPVPRARPGPDRRARRGEVVAAGRTRAVDLALVGQHLRRHGAGHRLRRSGQPPGQRDDLAPRILPLHPGHAGRAAGLLAAGLPARPRRRGPRAAGHAGGDRQHRVLRGRDAHLPAGGPVRRLAGRHDHPSGRSGHPAAAAAADVLRQVRPGRLRRAATRTGGDRWRVQVWSASATAS